jgi:tol-pal system protein YbgF
MKKHSVEYSLKATIAMLLGSMLVPLNVIAADSTAERLERLERRMGQLSELVLQVDALKRENSELRGQIELQNHNIESLKKRQRDLYIDIDQRLSNMPASSAATATADTGVDAPPLLEASAPEMLTPEESPAQPVAPVVAASVVQPVIQQSAESVSAAERAEYDAAFKLLSPAEKRYGQAITAFDAFLKKYPTSALADNAQYWLAEAHYVSQHNEQAMQEFEKVVTLYPQSTKVSGALLKIGYLQQAAGQTEQARQTLNRVIREHPGSAAANMAKNRLQSIR